MHKGTDNYMISIQENKCNKFERHIESASHECEENKNENVSIIHTYYMHKGADNYMISIQENKCNKF